MGLHDADYGGESGDLIKSETRIENISGAEVTRCYDQTVGRDGCSVLTVRDDKGGELYSLTYSPDGNVTDESLMAVINDFNEKYVAWKKQLAEAEPSKLYYGCKGILSGGEELKLSFYEGYPFTFRAKISPGEDDKLRVWVWAPVWLLRREFLDSIPPAGGSPAVDDLIKSQQKRVGVHLKFCGIEKDFESVRLTRSNVGMVYSFSDAEAGSFFANDGLGGLDLKLKIKKPSA